MPSPTLPSPSQKHRMYEFPDRLLMDTRLSQPIKPIKPINPIIGLIGLIGSIG